MPSESLPLTVLQEIDRVCDSFEAAWHAGLKPRIEDYLNVTTLEYRTELFGELLAREVELRKKAGAPSCPRTVRASPALRSPAERLNGMRYHPEWLQNLLISASLGGYRRPPRKAG